jgi:hypothetical protein
MIFAFFALSTCGKLDIEKNPPVCIQEKINTFSKNSPCNDSSVEEYLFQGNIVYVFAMGSCGADMGAEVIDYECKDLGMLGGYFGITKINGVEFSNAKLIRIIWKKNIPQI